MRRVLSLLAGLFCVFLTGCVALPAAPDRASEPLIPAAAAPSGLGAALHSLAATFPGRVGIAVQSVAEGWTVGEDTSAFYPQQSVSKLWVAIALLDAVDHGRLSLSEPITVTRADMSVFNQPIQKALADGDYHTTLGDLLVYAIARSDNAANDILVRRLGGPAIVARFLRAKHLGGVRASPPEYLLQSRIAGLSWRPAYSFDQAFETARAALPADWREAHMAAYLAHPADGATPAGMVAGLSRLKRGELLSPASTKRLLDILDSTTTGPQRLKAGLAPGWTLGHKTGTGQDLGDMTAGYNDVGLMTAPDGQVYAVAVMIASTRAPIPARQALMADVARAVVAAHDAAAAR